MAISNIQNQDLYLANSLNKAQFGILTGAKTQQAQQAGQNQHIQKPQVQKPQEFSFKELSNEDIENADLIAQSLNPQTKETNFKEDLKDIWNSFTTMFKEPTEEELAQSFKEIDSYSSLKPQNYYANVDSNNEVIPQYDEEDLYQLVA